MFTNQSSELSLNAPIPALEAVRGDRVRSRFWAGTASVRASEDSFLYLLSFHNDADRLTVDTTFSHPTGPVSKIVSAPTDGSLLLTTAENQDGCTLWKVPVDVMEHANNNSILGGDDDDDFYDNRNGPDPTSDVAAMEQQAILQVSDIDDNTNQGYNSSSKIVDMAWRGGFDEEPTSSFGDVLTLSADGTLNQWDVAFGSAETTRTNTFCRTKVADDPVCAWNLPPRMAWDPHHADQVAVSVGTKAYVVDLRQNGADEIMSPGSLSSSSSGTPHHRYGITDLDMNPNKPNILTTSGKDGLVKFWDLRSARQPLLVARGGHQHWVSTVAYNPFHDQLVLSAGTDSVVNLWRMSTISSAPLLTLDDEEAGGAGGLGGGGSGHETIYNMQSSAGPGIATSGRTSDVKVSPTIPEGPNIRVSSHKHMDSVGAIAWGASDAWIYASASYDGKVILNHVPSKEKYRILL
jgi:EARP and GARP complex-interacting protein 1